MLNCLTQLDIQIRYHLDSFAMKYPNLISASISNTQLNEILDAVHLIDKKLPALASVSDLEQSTLHKSKSDTVTFVMENLRIANEHPEIVPEDVNLDEIRKDVALIKSIDKVLQPLKYLVKRLEDSQMIAGSEAYLPSIAIYNAYKARMVLNRSSAQHSVAN
jgi:hypothetical protein